MNKVQRPNLLITGTIPLRIRLTAEFLGTLFLLATVVGSGIMGESLAQGNDAVALLGNTLATGAVLVVLITVCGDLSGAHFNPAVTVVFLLRREITKAAAMYLVVQVVGAMCGTMLANSMFELEILHLSARERTGFSQWLAEGIAAFGLTSVILGTLRVRPQAVAAMVGLYISAGYWFTASSSFANPAVTIARCFSDTFSGISPIDVPGFVIAQFSGALVAFILFKAFDTALNGRRNP